MSVIDSVTNDNSSQDTKPPASDLLAGLVGEGKKFKSVEDLAVGKAEADAFIEQLKRENADLRGATKTLEQKATEQKTLTDILDALKSGKQEQGTNQNPVSLEDLTKLVKSVTAREREETNRQTNKELVDKTLVTKFGDTDKAAKAIKDKAKELGLGASQIRELSESSPAAFLQLFGVTNQSSVQSAVKGNVNSDAINTLVPDGERKYSYYRALRQKMGFQKFSADFELQRQMQRDMNKHGATFNDL